MSKREWTEEQKVVIRHKPCAGQTILVSALPGTGKTTVCEEIIKQHACAESCRIFFTMLSLKLATEAQERLKDVHVECGTFYSLALNVCRIIHKIDIEVCATLEGTDRGILWTLESFWRSVDAEIEPKHVSANKKRMRGHNPMSGEKMLAEAKQIWQDMCDLKRPVTHQSYMKMCCLHPDAPEILSRLYHVLIVDEAQDVPPCFVEFLGRVTTQKDAMSCCVYYVGDPNQQIYCFSGAASAFSVAGTHMFNLTQTFRFGPSVSKIANSIVSTCRLDKTVPMPEIVSHSSGPETCFLEASCADECALETLINQGILDSHRCIAVICRYNTTILEYALKLVGLEKNFHMVGDPIVELAELAISWAEQYHAWPPDKREAGSQYALKRLYSRPEGGGKDAQALSFVMEFSTLSKRFEKFDEFNKPLNQAQVVLLTAHQSKGMEFDTVMLADDYPEIFPFSRGSKKGCDQDEETNILFVAVTRCKTKLFLNTSLSKFSRQSSKNSQERQEELFLF